MTQVIITGRYGFTITEEEKDLVADRLQSVCLTSFRETAQWKKAQELPHVMEYINTDASLVE